MSPLKEFEEYIKQGIVKQQTGNNSRAKSLIRESKTSKEFLNQIIITIGINDQNANTIIKISYDIIMELIRAKMLTDNFNASGNHAHEAEIAFLRKLNLKESEINFCDKLRYFRNGIMYYGKSFDKDYAEKVIEFMEKIILKIN